MKEYVITIKSEKTKKQIATKIGVAVESILTHQEYEDKIYKINPNQIIT